MNELKSIVLVPAMKSTEPEMGKVIGRRLRCDTNGLQTLPALRCHGAVA